MKKQFLFLFAALVLTFSVDAFSQSVQDFTLVNATGVTIHHVYLSPPTTDSWEEDVLGKDVFMDGEETPISFSPSEESCLWDLKIADADGNAITWTNIDLCKWSVVTLHWDGKKATATFE